VSYEDARARLATVLATVAITSPIVQSIQRVYTEPPQTIQDAPCIILFGSDMDEDWTAGGAAVEQQQVELVQLFLKDEDAARAFELAMAYRAAILTTLKAESGLAGHAVISGLHFDRPAGLEYPRGSGVVYAGLQFTVTFSVISP
jgi:hypothetical protein